MRGYHYLQCADCPRQRSTKFSVVMDDDGTVARFECARCGSKRTERGPDA